MFVWRRWEEINKRYKFVAKSRRDFRDGPVSIFLPGVGKGNKKADRRSDPLTTHERYGNKTNRYHFMVGGIRFSIRDALVSPSLKAPEG